MVAQQSRISALGKEVQQFRANAKLQGHSAAKLAEESLASVCVCSACGCLTPRPYGGPICSGYYRGLACATSDPAFQRRPTGRRHGKPTCVQGGGDGSTTTRPVLQAVQQTILSKHGAWSITSQPAGAGGAENAEAENPAMEA
eukprot:6468734-Amphidinium_carterae.3